MFCVSNQSIYSCDLYSITQEDIDAVKQSGYEGDIKLIYTDAISTTTSLRRIAIKQNGDMKRLHEALYVKETYGTMHCDEQYLAKLFSNNGEIKVLAGNLKEKSLKDIINSTKYCCFRK